MTAQKPNTYRYSVAPEEIDGNGRITVPRLCNNIINAIGRNIRLEGYGIDVMASEGKTWMLIRSAFEFDLRPVLYDDIDISVWAVPGSGLVYSRCVKLIDGRGREIGRGTTEWCVVDKQARRPVRSALLFKDAASLGFPCDKPRRIHEFDPESVSERRICYSECDFNGHLNNNKYVEMFYNILPETVQFSTAPVRLDINYRHEARMGAEVALGLKRSLPDEFLFLARTDGDVLCSAALATS